MQRAGEQVLIISTILIVLVNYFTHKFILCHSMQIFLGNSHQSTSISLVSLMCSSRKYPRPSQGRLTEIPRGRGFSKAQFFNESMTLKWNFQRGGGIPA